MNKICVLGSMNMDLVLQIEDMPKVGETILSKGFKKIPGGKGANQAVAAQRYGAKVYMVSKVGKDENGKVLVDKLIEDKINTNYVLIDEKEPTGMAMIMVNENGNNSIIVVPGANMAITNEDIEGSKEAIKESDIVISQFETPINVTLEAFKEAKKLNKFTILNPAPAKEIQEELLNYTDIIIPNETEAELITGVKVIDLESAKMAASKMIAKGVKFVIITLGSRGAAVISKEDARIIDAFKVNAIDTTAAGDSFIGALSSRLNTNNLTFEDLTEAVRFGNKVSSIAVQREGAQPSIPYLDEVLEIYKEN
ncbi:ribokinase [Clostridium chauvoei]|uniref:Ribokinase n=2 Tax=Clostridium chauvoei TaxID=46867 RepID=S6EIR6_9CLOT|nr:ribokinase [Clostridium chauvoei]ATD54479.1 ribokinase [Clostridium chauvoei]ATD57838.1 ribokinase [Clostridium chauvoei]MBX7281654.1 ribokinase [Clostridium chauvoei]MBX7284174.1 ribokinase [Clostridium chauvoei]MBX7286702.1 ribokinase [Clostridium chauvoei]